MLVEAKLATLGLSLSDLDQHYRGNASGAPEVEAATATVAKACVAHKALCGTFSTTMDVNARVAQGFKLFPLPRAAYGTKR